MCAPIEIRPFCGRPFMGTGKKTTFILVNSRPKGHPYAPTHVSKSLTVGRSAMRRGGGLSIASWGGVRAPFRWNFIFYIRFIVYVIKSPLHLYSYAPPARNQKLQRTLFTSGSVVLSMNKLELPAEFMPVPCPLADKSPIGFWIRQGAGDGLGQLPAFQPRGSRSRQQFTALALLLQTSGNRGRGRVGRALIISGFKS
jgi:hypothetical protein